VVAWLESLNFGASVLGSIGDGTYGSFWMCVNTGSLRLREHTHTFLTPDRCVSVTFVKFTFLFPFRSL
jgi:hypothetical protein